MKKIFLCSMLLIYSPFAFSKSKQKNINVNLNVNILDNKCSEVKDINSLPLENQNLILAKFGNDKIRVKDLSISQIQSLYEIEKEYYKNIDKLVKDISQNKNNKKPILIGYSEPKPPRISFDFNKKMSFGSESPKVNIVFFQSFHEMTKSKHIYDKIKLSMSIYPNQVRVTTYFYENSKSTLNEKYYLCASEQGENKAHNSIDFIYDNNGIFNRKDFLNTVNLNKSRFIKCFNSTKLVDNLSNEIEVSKNLGFNEPLVFINGIMQNEKGNILDIIDREMKVNNYNNQNLTSKIIDGINEYENKIGIGEEGIELVDTY